MQDLLQAVKFLHVGGISLFNPSIYLYRDNYVDAAYFTYNEGNTKCYCKQDHDLEETRQAKGGRVSGNVQCDDSV